VSGALSWGMIGMPGAGIIKVEIYDLRHVLRGSARLARFIDSNAPGWLNVPY
jgi:hypothetical protein